MAILRIRISCCVPKTHTHARAHACTHTRAHKRMHAHTRTQTRTHARTRRRARAHTQKRAHARTRTYTHAISQYVILLLFHCNNRDRSTSHCHVISTLPVVCLFAPSYCYGTRHEFRRVRRIAKNDCWLCHVCPTACRNSVPTGRIFAKFYNR